LQEAADADLLLHVVDAANPLLAEQMVEVQRVLADIGAGGVQQVLVYNKFDKLEPTQRPRSLVDTLELDRGVRVPRVFVSALTGQGLDELRHIISEAISGELPKRLNAADPTSPADPTDSVDEAGGQSARTGTQHFHS
jgi:GTPase